jgi:hypothetical protein
MLKDYKPISSVPTPPIKYGTITEKLIDFVEIVLILFQQKYKKSKISAEDVLNEKLEIILNHYSRTKGRPFLFKGEKISDNSSIGHKRKVDIGVMISTNSYFEDIAFFTIECKRLPTPGTNREKEYVIGNYGGMERFKRNYHGSDLSKSAIVGYIQSNDFEYWFNNINLWVSNQISYNNDPSIIWTNDDILIHQSTFRNKVAKYLSTNFRKDINSSILLLHYLLDLKN